MLYLAKIKNYLMRKLLFTLSVLILALNSNTLIAQSKSTNISINMGSSNPVGDYSYLKFNSVFYDKGYYPFVGGGANSGFNFGFASTYFFTKNIGLSVGYQFITNSIIQYQRIKQIESYLGKITYQAKNTNWTSHNTVLQSVATFPFLEEKLFIDFKAGVGVTTSSLPMSGESFQTSLQTLDVYGYSSESYISLSTKFDFGLRYYFKNFGIGAYLSSITAYTSNKSFVSVNTYSNQYGSVATTSKEKIGFDLSTLNFGLNLNYRLMK